MSEPRKSTFEIVAASRAALVRVVRMAFVVLLAVVVLLYILKADPQEAADSPGFNVISNWWVPLLAALVLATVTLAIDYLTPTKKLSAISGLVLGLISGLLATFAIGFIVDLLVQAWEIKQINLIGTVKVLTGIALCYLAISTVLQSQDDFRLVIPYVEFAKQVRGPKPLLLDSSVLIDSRIGDVAQTGFVQNPMVIPRFIVDELQLLADSADKLRRAKGRRGLEAITKLQRMRARGLDVTIDEAMVPGKGADARLVELARITPATIATCDSALIRVAGIQGVECVNFNELARAMTPVLLLGTQMELMILRKGEQPTQGVGYLDDGGMVVVEGASGLIGQLTMVEVTGTVQTSAGRLVFARPVHAELATEGAELHALPAEQAQAVQNLPMQAVVASALNNSDAPPLQTEQEAAFVSEEEASVQADEASGPLGPRLKPKPIGRNPRR